MLLLLLLEVLVKGSQKLSINVLTYIFLLLNSWCYLERVTPRCYLWFRYKVSFRVKMHTLIFRFLFNQLSSGSEISFESILGILVTLRGKLS